MLLRSEARVSHGLAGSRVALAARKEVKGKSFMI